MPAGGGGEVGQGATLTRPSMMALKAFGRVCFDGVWGTVARLTSSAAFPATPAAVLRLRRFQ